MAVKQGFFSEENSVKTPVDQIPDRSAHDHCKCNKLPFRKAKAVALNINKYADRCNNREDREEYLHPRDLNAERYSGILDIGDPENIINKRS